MTYDLTYVNTSIQLCLYSQSGQRHQATDPLKNRVPLILPGSLQFVRDSYDRQAAMFQAQANTNPVPSCDALVLHNKCSV